MLVKVKRHLFDSSDDASLIWLCIGPTMDQVRGKSFLVKMEALSRLSPSQRALFLFQVVYGHSAKGVLELFNHLSYLLTIPGVWAEIKNGIRYFGESGMLPLLDEMEELHGKLREACGGLEAGWLDFERAGRNAGLLTEVKRIDDRMERVIPEAVMHIGAYVRCHPDEYVDFV